MGFSLVCGSDFARDSDHPSHPIPVARELARHGHGAADTLRSYLDTVHPTSKDRSV
jgi:hypothetical protein